MVSAESKRPDVSAHSPHSYERPEKQTWWSIELDDPRMTMWVSEWSLWMNFFNHCVLDLDLDLALLILLGWLPQGNWISSSLKKHKTIYMQYKIKQ